MRVAAATAAAAAVEMAMGVEMARAVRAANAQVGLRVFWVMVEEVAATQAASVRAVA